MASWYEERILAPMVERTMADHRIKAWRREALTDVAGEIVEFGFGSGPNLRFYGPDVTSIRAVEPVHSAWERAQKRIRDFGRPVERIGLDGARVELPAASADMVVTTWTMCTIPDLASALGEAKRVLRPGGRLVFVEHSQPPDAGLIRWQRRIQPLWGRLAGGCHLGRDIPGHLEKAGFDVHLDRAAYAMDGPARISGWFVRGHAVLASP